MTPRLTTVRLILDAFTPEDVPALVELAGHPEVAATTFRIPHPYAADDAAEYIADGVATLAKGEGAFFAIRREGRLVGSVNLHVKRVHDRGEVSYFIGREHWNQGYATEAVRAVVAFGFRHFALEKILANHFGGNASSGRVLEKSGLTREGLHLRHVKKCGVFLDLVSYGITRPAAVAQGLAEAPTAEGNGARLHPPLAMALAGAEADALERARLARHFGGRSPADLERELRVHGRSLAGDFARLAPAALGYYLPAAAAYLKSEYAEGDWDFAHALAGALAAQIGGGRLPEETREQARALVREIAAQAGRFHLAPGEEPLAGWVKQAEA